MRRLIAPCVVALVCGLSAPAQQPNGNQSTGQEGQFLPGPFRVYAVNGSRAKHFHCFFTETGLNPAVAIIALQPPARAEDPLGVLMSKLDAFAAAHKADQFQTFAIFLSLDKPFLEQLDRDSKVGAIESLVTTLGLKGEMSLGLGDKEAQPVKQYGIVTNDDAINNIKKHAVTVLVYNKHKVEKRFTFTEDKKLDEAAIKEIFAAVEKMIPPKK